MPAYWVARSKINNPVEYRKYTDRVPEIIARFGGKVLARGGRYLKQQRHQHGRGGQLEQNGHTKRTSSIHKTSAQAGPPMARSDAGVPRPRARPRCQAAQAGGPPFRGWTPIAQPLHPTSPYRRSQLR